MRWDLRLEQRHGLGSSRLTQVVKGQTRALTRMHGSTSLKVGQRKVTLAVPSVRRSKEREQCRVLAERQELSITPSPAPGCKVERKDADFRHKRIGHGSLLGWGWEDSEQRDDKVDAQIRLEVCMRLASACRTDRLGVQGCVGSRGNIRRVVWSRRRNVTGRVRCSCVIAAR